MPSTDADRPRLLVVTQPTSAGVAHCVRDQVDAALEAGFDVDVACPGPSTGPLAGWVASSGARHIEIDLRRSPHPTDLTGLFRLRKLMRSADLVHLHSSKAGALGRAAALLLGPGRRPPIVFTPHAWSWLVGGRLARAYVIVEKALAGVADRIIAVSNAEAGEGRRVLGDAPIDIINNGVDLERFAPDGPAADRRPEPLVVCVGRLAHQKGQDVAIEAWSHIESSEARLRLVGSGDEEALRGLAVERGVETRIEWYEATPEPAPHLRTADVVAVPSRWDGQSLVLLEAMAVGAAIVATGVGGTEVASDAVLLVPIEDEIALADAIDRLLSDPALRRTLSERAARRARDFDIRYSLARTVDVWNELLRLAKTED